MERNPKHFVSCGLALALIVALSLMISACSSGSSSTPTQSSAVTPPVSPTSATTATPTETPSPTPSTSPSPTTEVPPLVISTSSLPDGEVGTPYSQNLEVTSISGNFTWFVSTGFLPIGLTLDSATGTISGTPTAAATYFFGVTVNDNTGASGNKIFSINIDVNPSATPPVAPTPASTTTPTTTTIALTITTTSLPAGTVNDPYSQGLTASNGTRPLVWSYWIDPRPEGLKLDASTGVIFGTPVAHGTFNLTIAVKDSAGAIAAGTLSIVINTP
jgi:hypothetical protein